MTIANASPRLYNEDLAPARERNWGAFSIFNVWTSDVHSLWGYYLAASLFLICGNFINFIATGRWVPCWVAFQTTPIPPSPRRPVIS